MTEREMTGVDVTDRPAHNSQLTYVAAGGFAVGGVAWLLAAWIGDWNLTYFVLGCASFAMAGAFASRAAVGSGGGGG